MRIYQERSLDLALARANRDALAAEVVYKTIDGYDLTWRVHSVRFVSELAVDEIDGEEIFSRSLTSADAHNLLARID